MNILFKHTLFASLLLAGQLTFASGAEEGDVTHPSSPIPHTHHTQTRDAYLHWVGQKLAYCFEKWRITDEAIQQQIQQMLGGTFPETKDIIGAINNLANQRHDVLEHALPLMRPDMPVQDKTWLLMVIDNIPPKDRGSIIEIAKEHFINGGNPGSIIDAIKTVPAEHRAQVLEQTNILTEGITIKTDTEKAHMIRAINEIPYKERPAIVEIGHHICHT